ncbi:YcxB family protein [Actinoplanes sp. NPDC049681]|uniref:YcxB family protein n=1 Tax=Actinoplanes sp. NPDC049681 TaxID=3363905 RepID=UPI0037B2803E
MLIELQSGRTPHYGYGRRRRLRTMAAMPWWRLVGGTVPIVLVAFAAWWWESTGLAVFAAAGFGYALLGGWLTWRRIAAAIPAARPLDRRWTITEESIRVADGRSAYTWRWAAVVAVEVRPDVYLLRQDGGIALDVPRAALTAAQDGELRRFLGGRGLVV